MSRLLDPKDKSGKFPFDYTPAHKTDVRETWKRFGYAAPQVSPLKTQCRESRSEPTVAAPLRIIAKRPK